MIQTVNSVLLVFGGFTVVIGMACALQCYRKISSGTWLFATVALVLKCVVSDICTFLLAAKSLISGSGSGEVTWSLVSLRGIVFASTCLAVLVIWRQMRKERERVSVLVGMSKEIRKALPNVERFEASC